MPGDPKECREKARRCAELAANAPTSTMADLFIDIAAKWAALAAALEKAEQVIATWDVAPPDN
jgi:phage gp29-like protein